MVIELVNTGSELMLGRVLNSHQQWLCRRLADLGYAVSRQIAIADTPAEIAAAVQESLGRADLVITTGGLGPTSDDLTRDSIARLLGRTLREDAATLAAIEAFYEIRKRPMPPATRIQAMVPEGARVLQNLHGTAPGLALQVKPNPFRKADFSWLIMLPGPPRELHPMFVNSVVPLLVEVFPHTEAFVSRNLRSIGIGESSVQERIEPALADLTRAGLEIGYCASPGGTDVRLAGRGPGAEQRVAEAEVIVRRQIGQNIYGVADDEVETLAIKLLKDHGLKLALAESCTGGGIGHRLTNVPGASDVFWGGFVTYSNEAKQSMLGVRAETLSQHGAVSEAVAREMAEGARRASGADCAIAVTGIAGPGGGTPEKPVGTVFIAVATPRELRVKKMLNIWDRVTFKEVTTRQALNELLTLLAPRQ